MATIVKTADGSDTIYVPELDEHYHSVHGAFQESQHIFTGHGFRYCKAAPARILEIGFGTGLNSFLTAIVSREEKRKVIYTSLEKYPLDTMTSGALNYRSLFDGRYSDLFSSLHEAPWGKLVSISEYFTLEKIHDDLITSALSGSFDIIYFDAFGPDKQPEMWTTEVFEKISSVTTTGGLFLTYSAKGEVKRKLRACGFEVFLLPGPPGKRQIIRAIKK